MSAERRPAGACCEGFAQTRAGGYEGFHDRDCPRLAGEGRGPATTYRPARRPPPWPPVVHPDPRRNLTLSEVSIAPAADDPQPVHTREPSDITARIGNPDPLALTIAAHLSTRAAGAVANVAQAHAFALRAAYLADALRKAARCPLCGPELRDALSAAVRDG